MSSAIMVYSPAHGGTSVSIVYKSLVVDLNTPRSQHRRALPFRRIPFEESTEDHAWLRPAGLGAGAIVLGLVAGASVSLGPFWLGWALLLALAGGYGMLRSTIFGLSAVIAAMLLLPFG